MLHGVHVLPAGGVVASGLLVHKAGPWGSRHPHVVTIVAGDHHHPIPAVGLAYGTRAE